MAQILIIDDDASMRTTLESTLKLAGHDVTVASDGNEGIQLFRLRPADLVICDLFMPNKEGLETITELCQDFPQVAIVAMSGGHINSNQMLAVARMLGDVRILEKPFNTEALLMTVEGALR